MPFINQPFLLEDPQVLTITSHYWWLLIIIDNLCPPLTINNHNFIGLDPSPYEQCSKSLIPLYWLVKNGVPLLGYEKKQYIE